MAISGRKANELQELYDGPGNKLGERKAVERFAVGEPSVGHRLSGDIGIDGIGTTNRQGRHLPQQDRDAAVDVLPTERHDERDEWNEPERKPQDQGPQESNRGGARVVEQIFVVKRLRNADVAK